MVRVSSGMVRRMAAVLDASIILAVALVFQLPQIGGALTLAQAVLVGMTGAASFIVAVKLVGAYRLEAYRSRSAQFPGLLLGLMAAAVADRVVVWAFRPAVLDQNGWLIAWTAATLGALFLGREGVTAGLNWFSSGGGLQKRVAVIGATALTETLIKRLQDDGLSDYRLVGVFDPCVDGANAPSRNSLGTFDDFERAARSRRIDMIVIAASWRNPAVIFDLVERVQWVSADVVALLDDGDRLGRASQRVSVAGMPALKLSAHPLRGTEGLVKAAQDYAVAIMAVVLAAPIMLIAALAIRMGGPGPILFRQTRVGFNGRTFDIYKFRTMTVDPTDDGSLFKPKGDSRITRVGAFLRQTSLDELPQLFNVLAGDMSIVGPRPHVPNMSIGTGAYAETVRTYAGRCQIKPGITGWAQINGMRGGIDTLEKARRGVELDLHYIRNWSLGLDLEIMLKTLTRNMAGRNVF